MRQLFAAGFPGPGHKRQVFDAAEIGHGFGKREAQQQVCLAVAVRNHVDRGLPARVLQNELLVDPIPAEIPDGHHRHSGDFRRLDRNRRNIDDNHRGPAVRQEFCLLSHKNVATAAETERGIPGCVEVNADGIPLDHAEVERACNQVHASPGEPALEKTARGVGNDHDVQVRTRERKRAENVAGARGVTVAVGGDVVDERALLHSAAIFEGRKIPNELV